MHRGQLLAPVISLGITIGGSYQEVLYGSNETFVGGLQRNALHLPIGSDPKRALQCVFRIQNTPCAARWIPYLDFVFALQCDTDDKPPTEAAVFTKYLPYAGDSWG